MFEVGKRYFFRLKGANREIQYTGTVIEIEESCPHCNRPKLIKINDRDNATRILNIGELIESEAKT